MAATTMQKKQLREMVAEQARNMAALEMKTAAANPRCSESGAAEKTGGNVLHEHDKWLQDTKNPNCNCEPHPPRSPGAAVSSWPASSLQRQRPGLSA